MKTLGLDLGTR